MEGDENFTILKTRLDSILGPDWTNIKSSEAVQRNLDKRIFGLRDAMKNTALARELKRKSDEEFHHTNILYNEAKVVVGRAKAIAEILQEAYGDNDSINVVKAMSERLDANFNPLKKMRVERHVKEGEIVEQVEEAGHAP